MGIKSTVILTRKEAERMLLEALSRLSDLTNIDDSKLCDLIEELVDDKYSNYMIDRDRNE